MFLCCFLLPARLHGDSKGDVSTIDTQQTAKLQRAVLSGDYPLVFITSFTIPTLMHLITANCDQAGLPINGVVFQVFYIFLL